MGWLRRERDTWSDGGWDLSSERQGRREGMMVPGLITQEKIRMPLAVLMTLLHSISIGILRPGARTYDLLAFNISWRFFFNFSLGAFAHYLFFLVLVPTTCFFRNSRITFHPPFFNFGPGDLAPGRTIPHCLLLMCTLRNTNTTRHATTIQNWNSEINMTFNSVTLAWTI